MNELTPALLPSLPCLPCLLPVSTSLLSQSCAHLPLSSEHKLWWSSAVNSTGDTTSSHEHSRRLGHLQVKTWVSGDSSQEVSVLPEIPNNRSSAGKVTQSHTLLPGAHEAQVLNTMLVSFSCCDHRTLVRCDFKAQECVPSSVRGGQTPQIKGLAGPYSL